MLVGFDTESGPRPRITSVDGLLLLGACHRCGACCVFDGVPCPHLAHETSDGVPQAVCRIEHDKPFRCVFWPLPHHELPEGCGFRYGVHA